MKKAIAATKKNVQRQDIYSSPFFLWRIYIDLMRCCVSIPALPLDTLTYN